MPLQGRFQMIFRNAFNHFFTWAESRLIALESLIDLSIAMTACRVLKPLFQEVL